MEIFGVGGLELVLFLLIALIVAGPKRMIQWSYTLGKWASSARKMWSETAAMIQKELDKEGIDFKVPTEPPTKASLNKSIKQYANPLTKPVQDAISGVKTDLAGVKKDANVVKETAAAVSTSTRPAVTPKPPVAKPVVPKPAVPPPVSTPEAHATTPDAPSSNGDASKGEYGTWSG